MFLLVLLVAYWAAVHYELTDDVLCLGFGEDFAASWDAYLAEQGANSSSTTPSGGRKMALIINITYRDTQARYNAAPSDKGEEPESVGLPGTYTDGNNMKKYLQSQGFQVTWMRDNFCDHENGDTSCDSCRSEYSYPNAKNIRRAMRGIAESSREGDVLWFFFAGHGSQIEDHGGSEDNGMDEMIMPADYDLDCDFITDDWFASSKFRGAIHKKAETVAVFDCCHSGTMFDLPWSMDVDDDPTTDKWIRDVNQPADDEAFFFYLSGCQDQQTSAELTTISAKGVDRNGAMTQGFMKLIKDNAMNGRSLSQFCMDLRKLLHNHKSLDGKPQKPNICCTFPFDLAKSTFQQMFDGEIPSAAERSGAACPRS